MSSGFSINGSGMSDKGTSALSPQLATGFSASAAPGFSIELPSGGTVTITMPTSVDEIDGSTDLGATFQATGGHTLFGHGTYFDGDQYLWTSVNGVGVDPNLSGTGHEVTLSGTAPFSSAAWATAAETAISGAGYSVSRVSNVLTVSNVPDAEGAAANQLALVDFAGRGDARLIGSLQEDAGTSTNADGHGWIQILPADVPSGAFRVIAFGCRRGANVTNGVRMAMASGGAAFDPENAVVDHDRTMGDSGANNWHWEYLSDSEIVEYSGGEVLWLGSHGDGANSSLFMGGAIDDGTNQNGATNLWLTDGTTGSTTATVSPVGAVSSSFNFGIALRILIQEAPYQTDGGYRVISGAIEGRHDGVLFETDVDNIFVGWRITPPSIDDLYVQGARIRLGAHASGATNQLRWEWWNPVGGANALNGDLLLQHMGNTSDSQGSGWSDLSVTPFSVTGGTSYRYTVKGSPSGGSESDTTMSVWLGTNGAGAVNLAGYPVYATGGVALNTTEREVISTAVAGDETQINFSPSVATASPNPSDGTVQSPNNTPMFSVIFGKPAPTVVAS